VWGPSVLLFPRSCQSVLPEKYSDRFYSFSSRVGISRSHAMLLLSWLRRHRASPQEVCATIGMAYDVLFGFSDYWAFNILPGLCPFGSFLRWCSPFPAVALTSAYSIVALAFPPGTAGYLENGIFWDIQIYHCSSSLFGT